LNYYFKLWAKDSDKIKLYFNHFLDKISKLLMRERDKLDEN